MTCRTDEGTLVDDRTGSEWDLDPVPGVVSFRDAWTTFHPPSELRSASGQAPSPRGPDRRNR